MAPGEVDVGATLRARCKQMRHSFHADSRSKIRKYPVKLRAATVWLAFKGETLTCAARERSNRATGC